MLGGDEPAWETEPAAPAGADAANAMLVRLAAVKAEIADTEALFAEQFDRLQLRLEETRTGQMNRLAWLETSLKLYHAARLREDPKATTIRLPHGILKSRAADDAWDYDDEKAFIVWAKQHLLDGVRYPEPKPQVSKPDVKKKLADWARRPDGRVVDADGNVVPGLRVSKGGFFGRHYQQLTD